MKNVRIEATEITPEVDFNYDTNQFRIAGESYPENAAVFYDPFLTEFYAYLDSKPDAEINIVFEMKYYNSSSVRQIIRIINTADAAAGQGCKITITWRYHSFDDVMEEFGEEYVDELEHATFVMEAIDD